MALKRKASFTTLTSPRAHSTWNATVSPVPFCPGNMITVDETPRHLHSRTRKRLKNDRPDDQTLYDKTMNLLFSAQKQSIHCNSSMPSTTPQPDADEPPQSTSSSTFLEPMQQTLRRFFRPAHHTSHGHTPMYDACSDGYSDGDLAPHIDPAAVPSGASSSSDDVDMDMGMAMAMEIDNHSSGSASWAISPKRWVGGIGWM